MKKTQTSDTEKRIKKRIERLEKVKEQLQSNKDKPTDDIASLIKDGAFLKFARRNMNRMADIYSRIVNSFAQTETVTETELTNAVELISQDYDASADTILAVIKGVANDYRARQQNTPLSFEALCDNKVISSQSKNMLLRRGLKTLDDVAALDVKGFLGIKLSNATTKTIIGLLKNHNLTLKGASSDDMTLLETVFDNI